MKLNSFFTLMALGLTVCLFAQQEKVLLPLNIQNRQLSDSGNSVAGKALEIVDFTGDSLTLGYMETANKGNDRIAITAPLAKNEYLNEIIGNVADNIFLTRNKRGLLLVRVLSVGKMSPGNYVHIKATLFESPVAGNAFVLVKEIDDIFSNNSSEISSVPAILATSILNAMSMPNGAILNSSNGDVKTKEEVLKFEQEKYKFIKNGVFRTGIYMSYEDFKNGSPSFGQFYLRTDTASKFVEVNSFTIEDSTLRPVKPWGIAVANELYLYNNGVLYPIEPLGNNLVFSKYLDPEIRRNNSMYWRMNVGNRFSEFQAGNPFDNRYVLNLTNYLKKGISGEATKVDADTGMPAL
ncbi:hypothetical protein [Niabella sp.]|uniref:hypothetical protein n=1 Tax=Niabella sp. TaxID=1962976 RepID=UPI002623308B|nr:hypothetical protein [Niabella sp.]